MKHQYFVGAALLCLPTTAQLQRDALPAHPEHKDHGGSAINGPQGSIEMRGMTYYSESFDSGLNGWTVNTPSGVPWEWTDVGPGTTTSTYPVPVLNTSTPSGWVMVDDDALGQGLTTNASLISPTIDLSGAPQFLKLEFDQYFQEWQEDHCFVGVSTDNGATWTEIEVNDSVGRDGRPNPELVDIDISAWVAVDPANVQLRFRYTSVWDYGWQLDNITITDLPANDMALLKARITGFDFANFGLANIDYSIYPLSQIRGMELNGEMKNKGYDPQTNASLNVSVDGPNGNEFTDASAGVNLMPGDVDLPTINGFQPSGDLGSYTVDFSVTQDQIDENPTNNDRSISFEISSTVWAQDDGVCDQFQTVGPDNLGEAFWVGNYIDLVADAQMHSIQVAIHEDTDPGVLIQGLLLDINNDVVEFTAEHTVAAGDLNALGGSNFVTMDFAQPVDLFAGEAYAVMVQTFGGPENVTFCTSGISVPQVSIIHYPQMVAPNFFYVTKTPMVRGVLIGPIGINGPEALVNGDLSISPNPSNTNAQVQYVLQTAAEVSMRLCDATGRTVLTGTPGVRSAGTHSMTLDLSDLSSGAYVFTLTVDGYPVTRRILVD